MSTVASTKTKRQASTDPATAVGEGQQEGKCDKLGSIDMQASSGLPQCSIAGARTWRS